MRKLDERAEGMIAEGLQLQEGIREKQGRLEFLSKQLAAYFPGASQVESLPTVEGTALRILDERVQVNPLRLPEIKAMLGKNFDKYFTLEPKAYPTTECLQLLSSGSSHLGLDLREHMIIRREFIVHISPAKLGRVVNLTPEELA